MVPSRFVVPVLLASVAAAAGVDTAEFLSSTERQLSSNQTKAWKVWNVKTSAWGNSVGRVAYFDDSTRPGFAFSGGKKSVKADQFRNGVKLWSGEVLLWKGTEYMIGSCSPGKCTGMVRRAAGHMSYQWEYGDLIHVQKWEAAGPPKAADSDSGGDGGRLVLVIVLVIIIIVVLGLCFVAAYFYTFRGQFGQRAEPEAQEQKAAAAPKAITEVRDEAAASPAPPEVPAPTGTAAPAGKRPHETLFPSRWCVTPEQFAMFMQTVDRHFPDSDPSVQEVVDAVVKPATAAAGTSWALLTNREGVPCRHFVTHTWQGGVKQLGESIKDADPSGGIWIDFLAFPQTLPEEERAELIGADMWSSPVAKAIHMCEDVIHVRNPEVHHLSRLWCVFEHFLAWEEDKPVTTVGSEGDPPASQAMGLAADCTRPEDLAALRAALDPRKDTVNEWLDGAGMVVAADL